jgi:hypothetical protein
LVQLCCVQQGEKLVVFSQVGLQTHPCNALQPEWAYAFAHIWF